MSRHGDAADPMKSYSLERRLWLPEPPERIFAFFSDPANLERLTPPWLRFQIVTPLPVIMGQGTRIDYRLRIRGIPILWQSEITHWEPPYGFTDRQIKGPYLLWIHEHSFVPRQGGTIVGDDVQYAVPGGMLVQRLLVGPDLNRIFEYRHRTLAQLFHAPNRVPFMES
jgi:ligand-binding SRPBCC domain-containing protein